MQTFLIVVVSILAGVLLCGLGVFLFVFFRALQRLTAIAETLHLMLLPVLEKKQLVQWVRMLEGMSEQGSQAIQLMQEIAKVLRQFNRLAFSGQAPASGTMAEETELASVPFGAPSDAQLANREEIAEMMKVGVRSTPPEPGMPDQPPEPDQSQMRGEE